MESAGETVREREYDGLRDLKLRLSDEPVRGDGERNWWAVKSTMGWGRTTRSDHSFLGLFRRRQELDLHVDKVSECAGRKSKAATHGKDADFAGDQRRRGLVVVGESEQESAQSVADRVDEGEISYRSHARTNNINKENESCARRGMAVGKFVFRIATKCS
jgi:hypothetical protein